MNPLIVQTLKEHKFEAIKPDCAQALGAPLATDLTADSVIVVGAGIGVIVAVKDGDCEAALYFFRGLNKWLARIWNAKSDDEVKAIAQEFRMEVDPQVISTLIHETRCLVAGINK